MESTIMQSCPADSDLLFGPQVSPQCREFDFTLYFEDLFFIAIPAATFLCLLPEALFFLRGKPSLVKRSRLLAAKTTVLISLISNQAVFLALRIKFSIFQNNASVAADVLFLAALCGALVLSHLDHARSVRPSTLLTVWLSAMMLLSMVRVRTLFLIKPSGGIPILSSVILGLTIVSLILESIEKRRSVVSVSPDATPEQFSGFWKRTSFAWLAETFRLGYSRIISVEDLPSLDPKLSGDVLHKRLEETWLKCDKKKYRLLKSCFRAFGPSVLSGIVPRLCVTGFTFAQPFLISTAITFVGNENASPDVGRGLIGAFALVYIGLAASTALYWYQTFQFLIRLRGSLISLIYRQTMQARSIDLGEKTAITLMGTDVERIVSGFRSIHELWGSILDMIIAICLLEQQVFVACIVPAVISTVFIFLTFKLSTRLKASQRVWIEKVEARLKITSSMLGDMKAVKMLGLTEKMESIVQGLRETEIETSKIFRKLIVWEIFFSDSPSDLAPMATFAFFVIVAVARHENSLLTAQAFTALSLIALLTAPVLTFIQAVPSIIQCLGCFERIQEYCNAPPTSSVMDTQTSRQTESLVSLCDLPGSDILVSFDRCDFGWSKTEPVLKDITARIDKSLVTVIIGPVGSGKSTFLESILGETMVIKGKSQRHTVFFAYCSQTAWLTNQTIRQNITGNLDIIDDDWYTNVVWSCGLDTDFFQLALGDQTSVGSNGVNLSGGQRQRVALARAIYSRRDAILMDDIFSGMDSRSVALLSRRLFGANGLFRRHMITVVLATHTYKLLPFADNVIALEAGKIVEAGSLQTLLQSNGYTSSLDIKLLEDTEEAETSQESSSQDLNESNDILPVLDRTLDDLKRHNGDFSVYRYYAEVSGKRTVFLFMLFMLLYTFCSEFPTVLVKMWSSANEEAPNHDLGIYMGIYVFLALSGVLFMTASCWFFFITIMSRSALQLHKDLLHSALRAPFRFFTKTDVGSLTNRFSQDMELIDMDLPLMAINYVFALCSCVVKLVILVVFAEYLAITLPLVVFTIFVLQKFYLRTSRQVRLLDIESKAPLYSHFLESVSGATAIRAFGWQARFEETCQKLLDTSQRPVYLLYCIQQWLGFVLDLIVAALAVILVAIVVTWRDLFSPGAVGVSLVVVMTFNKTLMSLVKYWTLLETSIGAVSRVKAFVASTESEDKGETCPLPKAWPTNGAVTFSNVIATYTTADSSVLKGISMSIKPGEKVAICGRSGSGKTSVILCLLQMLQVSRGSISIDDVDIAGLSHADLRSKINVVPQDPFLMPGTVRFNIDPFQAVSDEVIIEALHKVRIWKLIQDNGGLDKIMDMASWSVGQRQLLCLARAIVRKSALLVLDEATSSVDQETEVLMQEIIEKEFAGATVLAVMHRLTFIKHWDKVALLDAGNLLEFDSPGTLLQIRSRFADLYQSGGH